MVDTRLGLAYLSVLHQPARTKSVASRESRRPVRYRAWHIVRVDRATSHPANEPSLLGLRPRFVPLPGTHSIHPRDSRLAKAIPHGSPINAATPLAPELVQ